MSTNKIVKFLEVENVIQIRGVLNGRPTGPPLPNFLAPTLNPLVNWRFLDRYVKVL